MRRPAFVMGDAARGFKLGALILGASAVIGCGVEQGPVQPAGLPAPAAAPAAPPMLVDERATAEGSWGPVLKAKIKVKDGSGKEVFAIKPKDDGAKLVGPADQELARYGLKGDKLKVKDASEKVLGYINGSGARYRVKDAEQKVVLFELRRQDDGDWKLEDGKESPIYRIKKRDHGYEIQDAREVGLAKVKTADGKVEVVDASDRVLYSTPASVVGPLPFAGLAMDKVGDLPMRAGLMIRIALEESQVPTPGGEAKR